MRGIAWLRVCTCAGPCEVYHTERAALAAAERHMAHHVANGEVRADGTSCQRSTAIAVLS